MGSYKKRFISFSLHDSLTDKVETPRCFYTNKQAGRCPLWAEAGGWRDAGGGADLDQQNLGSGNPEGPTRHGHRRGPHGTKTCRETKNPQ